MNLQMNQIFKISKFKVQMSNVQSNPNVKVQNKYRIYFDIWALTLICHLDFDIWILLD